MIAFRFHRGGFDESIKTLRIFRDTRDLFLFLASEYNISFRNFRIELYSTTLDKRCNWDFTNIILYLNEKDKQWYPIGWCSDSFHLVDSNDDIKKEV